MFLEIKDVKKSYGKDTSYIQVLKGVSTTVEKGQMCVIQGTSGSGKSTLLNCIGGLDTMDSGSVKVDGKEIFREVYLKDHILRGFKDVPDKDGYTFVGWELEDGTPVSDYERVENDMKLYA